jgi:hypothetical protein
MNDVRPQRGRPKGTGIDDRASLRAIAAVICENPRIRPTTAIKSLGISNPSIIRRLRDKYHAGRVELLAEAKAAAGVKPPAPAMSQLPMPAGAMRSAANPSRATAVHVAALASAAARAGFERSDSASLGPYAAWFGLGLAAAASAIEQQLSHSQQLIRLPALANLLRQQVELAEMMMVISTIKGKRPQALPAALVR